MIRVHGRTNPGIASSIYHCVVTYSPDSLCLVDNGFANSVKRISNNIHDLVSRKLDGKASSKGKGKASSGENVLTAGQCDISDSERASCHRHIKCLLEITDALAVITRIGGREMAKMIQPFLCPILPIIHSTATIFSSMDESLIHKSKALKLVLLEVLNELIHCVYLEPLESGDFEPVLDEFIEFMHGLISGSDIDGEAPYLVRAPVLVDLDIRHNLYKDLQDLRIIVSAKRPSEESRIEYLLQACECQVELTGNSAHRRKHLTPDVKMEGASQWLATQSPDSLRQVLEMFPHLEVDFVSSLMVTSGQNIDQVIEWILTESYPSQVVPSDNKEPSEKTESNEEPSLESILSRRANVHDGDDFDIFAHGRFMNPENVIQGKKDVVLDNFDRPIASEIIDRLELYEDEPDDTYDSAGIDFAGKAHADTTATNDPTLAYKELLLGLVESNPESFEKTNRKTPSRADLRRKTGLSDEQIEGWFLMLQRDVSFSAIM